MSNFATIKININEKLFLKDPEQTQLGRRIITQSIRLIDELGFEHFTFKKLADRLGSTEASVYRYFENKHNLLVYLISWYWSWLEYQIDYCTNNIVDQEQCLRIALRIITNFENTGEDFSYINSSALHRIVLQEASKVYHTKSVDIENSDGFFRSYKSLCKRIARIVSALNPNYPYPHTLVSTVLESCNSQVFFSQHLPSLTDLKLNKGNDEIIAYLEHLVFKQIEQ